MRGGEGVPGLLVAGRYRLVESIGEGGMGRVWRAVDEMLDRLVAVKEMRMDGIDVEDSRTRRERTLREARATARIDHPHVVRVYDVVDESERLWIVMELVAGRSLERITAETGPLGPRETARIGLGLVAALRQVHARGVLHRDIKPGNVLVEDAGQRVVLTDFGIAALQDAKALTIVGMLVGSPDYMAPERIAGRPQGPPSDIWSLGATLCAALDGHSPFSRETTLATLHAVLYEEPQLPAHVGPLREILAASLEKEPTLRAGLADLESALRLVADPPPPVAHREEPPPPTLIRAPATPTAPPRVGPRRRTALLAAGGVVAVATVVGIVLASLPGGGDEGNRAGSSPTASGNTSSHTSVSPSASPTVEGTARPPSLPPGAHQEAGGYAWATPKGWRRDVQTGAEVHYTAPDGRQELAAKSSLSGGDLMETWRTSEQNAHQGEDYRKIRLAETTFDGRPAVVWEYTFTLQGAPWHARLLGFDEGGKTYQINTWYRPDIETSAVRTYEKVKDSFTVL